MKPLATYAGFERAYRDLHVLGDKGYVGYLYRRGGRYEIHRAPTDDPDTVLLARVHAPQTGRRVPIPALWPTGVR